MRLFKFYIQFVFICLLQTVISAKGSRIDSLKQALKNAPNDTTRCNILATLSRDENDPKIWQVYNNELKAVAEKALKATSLDQKQRKFFLSYLADALNNIGYNYYKEGQNAKALKYFVKSCELEKEIGAEKRYASSLNNLGNVYKVQGELLKAANCFKESLKIAEKNDSKKLIAVSLNNLGSIYNRQGDIQQALKYYHRCLKIFEDLKDKEKIAIAISNIGKVYFSQKDTAKALEYYKNSLKLQEEINDKEGISVSYNDLGNLYKSQGNLTKALNYFFKSLAISQEIKYTRGTGSSLNNIGTTYFIMNKIDSALSYQERSLNIFEERNDKQGISSALYGIASVAFKKGETEKAFNLAERCLKIDRELGFPASIKNSAELLYKIHKLQNRDKEALAMHELFTQMNDSINNMDIRKASVKQQLKYEYEKRELTLKTEQEKKELKYADQSKTQKITIALVLCSILLVVLFLMFLLKRFKITNKQKKIIEMQKNTVDAAFDKLQEKNKEVTDSIIYARRIQRALLTSERYFEKQLNKLNDK